jgi:hypothetical protein
MNTTSHEAEQLERYSRRDLWAMLIMVPLFGVWAMASLDLFGPDGTALAGRFAVPLPSLIVIAVVALRSRAKGARFHPSNPAMKAMLNDELRQASLNLAWRNGFIAVLVAQPLLLLASIWTETARPAPLMACVTLVMGVVVAIATKLYVDR